MSQTIIRDCRVWDGSGTAAFPADVLIEGERIRAVARNRGQLDAAGAEVIEAGGMTLMPGLVEGHAHLSFGNAARAPTSATCRRRSTRCSPRATRRRCSTTASPAPTARRQRSSGSTS